MSRFRLALLSVLAVCAVSAVGASSASALEFYNSGGQLIQGLLNVISLGGLVEFRGQVFHILVHVSCEHFHNAGWIHNGLDGNRLLGLGLWLLLLLKCQVLRPIGGGCTVRGEDIHTTVHVLDLTIGGLPYLDFTPDPGPHFATITIENCTNSSLNGNYNLNGTIVALYNNSTSELEFTGGAPNDKLEFGGEPAEFEGDDKLEMEGGGNIEER